MTIESQAAYSLCDRARFIQALLARLACLPAILMFASLSVPSLLAQSSGASIQGTVTDSTGAVIPGATVTATNTETNLQRGAESGSAGLYVIPNLPPGKYRLQVAMKGFQTSIRDGIDLVVGQQLTLNSALKIGEVAEQVTVTGEAPLVDTSTAQVSGLVGERQVKDLPLNGRSFDNLITLNPAMVNTTAIKGGASSSTGPGNYFSIGGRRPGENVFLWNGIEYPGGSGAVSSTPGGVSGQLLGIDAVREFNVVPSIDSAEYGHRAGGQINVVTQSGSNSFHGSLFEFLRNSKLDARNYFDYPAGMRIPPFKRNQFGGSAGGPIQKDKTFIFGNYEGFRQRLGLSSVATVPNAQARKGFLPDANGVYQPVTGFNPAVAPYFALWPEPGPELTDPKTGLPTGTAQSFSNPPNPVREEFGTVRVDRTISDRDTLSGAYTVDDGESNTPGQNPFSLLLVKQRTQIASVSETHIFSPNVVNNFTAGFARPNFRVVLPVSIHPAGVEPFVLGSSIGQIKIGGGATVGAAGLTPAGSGPNTGSDQGEITNIFTDEDQVHITKGIHSITTGAWFKRLQNNETNIAYGQAIFSDLPSFLRGQPTSISVTPNQAELPWRSWMAAWFVQDAMKLRPNLTFSIGLRHEFTNGWNHLFGKAANYIPDSNGVLSIQPRIGDSIFTKNNAKKLFGPRAGLAWDPFGNGKTSIRAGFGIAYNLLDNIGWCCRSTHPDYSSYTLTRPPFPITVNAAAFPPPGIQAARGSQGGGGIQADAQTATVVNYRFEIERDLGAGMAFRVTYIGSHGYHDILRADPNVAIPTILADGTKFFACAGGAATCTNAPRRQPGLDSFVQLFTSAINNYNGIALDLNRHFRSGLAFRANYTYSKSMDNSSSISSLQATGNPSVVLDAYDRMRDYSLAAFNVSSRFSFNTTYELPFGSGKGLLGGAKGVADKLVGGWQLNTIVGLQSGFPFTPQLGFNQSRDGDRSTPDRPDMRVGRTLSGIYTDFKTTGRFYDASAFSLPAPGTYGNAGRNILTGPGLVSLDLSMFKTTRITERWNLQFRAEFFNLLNRANFGLPSPVVLTTSGSSAPAAGVISTTATTSREIQFGLKLAW